MIVTTKTGASLYPDKAVRYKKYTSCGNTFIIVDESTQPFNNDEQTASFSRWALDKNFGIGGADNVLFLKNRDHATNNGEYIFRIFEHDGAETLFCGNGLLSVADMLYRLTGRSTFGIQIGMRTGCATRVEIGVGERGDGAWVNVGLSPAIPSNIYHPSESVTTSSYSDSFTIPFPRGKEWTKELPDTLTLEGTFIFTGEPHLVFILGEGLPSELEEKIWLNLECSIATESYDTPAMKLSKNLVHYIGQFVNKEYCVLFPQGVHLNFARANKNNNTVEYRTYERAINRETLACGSGAVAVANVCWQTNILEKSSVILYPHTCSWYQAGAKLEVKNSPNGSILCGKPLFIYEGMTQEFLTPVLTN